jgi:hypothetical protein
MDYIIIHFVIKTPAHRYSGRDKIWATLSNVQEEVRNWRKHYFEDTATIEITKMVVEKTGEVIEFKG